jgi:hypothetical protein
MLIKISVVHFFFSFTLFSESPANEIYRIELVMIGGKSWKERELKTFFFYEFNNPFRRRINATPAEKSTSHIHHHHHHHHSIRHLCLVECVNFKRRNKKLLFLLFAYFLEL